MKYWWAVGKVLTYGSVHFSICSVLTLSERENTNVSGFMELFSACTSNEVVKYPGVQYPVIHCNDFDAGVNSIQCMYELFGRNKNSIYI
jgi:hypothetical protein